MHTSKIAIIVIAVLLTSIPTLAAPPTTVPAGQAPGVLGNGLISYTPPSGWEIGKVKGNVSSFVTAKHDGIVALELLPSDTSMMPQAHEAIIKQLTAARQKGTGKVLLMPVEETDARFAMKVHERYEVGRKDGSVKVADQLHLYRQVGSRVVMATVNTIADDPEVVAATHKAAEDMLVSAVLHKPGEKAATNPLKKPAP